MVDAQEARRILDRYGYEVSPVLWKKVMPVVGRRVQSVATRIVVERERERMAFIEASYWDVKGTFAAAQGDDQREFSAALNTIDGVRLSGRDDDGRLARGDVTVLDEAGAQALVSFDGVPYEVRARETKPYRRRPPPFITSTYQQEAGRKRDERADGDAGCPGPLRKGYITKEPTAPRCRTRHAGRPHDDLERYGKDFLPGAPPLRHEVEERAGSPRGDPSGGRHVPAPAEVAKVPQSEARAYELIWQRAVACR